MRAEVNYSAGNGYEPKAFLMGDVYETSFHNQTEFCTHLFLASSAIKALFVLIDLCFQFKALLTTWREVLPVHAKHDGMFLIFILLMPHLRFDCIYFILFLLCFSVFCFMESKRM